MRTISALLFSCATISSAAACGPGLSGPGDDNAGDDGSGGGDDQPGGRPDGRPVAPPAACQKMDLLFVVDDSGSMGEEQANLASNFPQFAEVLQQYMVEGGLPLDFRVAVTTTGRDITYTTVVTVPPIPGIPPIPPISTTQSEMGDDGAFRQECGMTRRWLERTDPAMATTFSCAANVGVEGPGWEMPLQASQLALSAPMINGMNSGFLRDDALLAIVYLTDENDCSRRDNNFTLATAAPCTSEPVQSWVDFFDDLKGGRGRWATAVIAGPTNCESDFGSAVAAPRMQEFVTLTGSNAVFSSICEGNLAPALASALDTFQAACDTFQD